MTTDELTQALAYIAAARGRAEAATPGPWHRCMANGGKCPCAIVWASEHAPAFDTMDGGEGYSAEVRIANAEFAVHARTDVPALCAIAEAAARLVAGLAAYNGDDWSVDDFAGQLYCEACYGRPERVGIDDIGLTMWAVTHEDDCPAIALDRALAALVGGQ